MVALETRKNEKGILRVCFNGGWVSEHAGNGAVCLEPVPVVAAATTTAVTSASSTSASVAPALAPAPKPEPAPAPEPVLQPEPVTPVAAEQPAAAAAYPAGEYKCVKKSQVRASWEMESVRTLPALCCCHRSCCAGQQKAVDRAIMFLVILAVAAYITVIVVVTVSGSWVSYVLPCWRACAGESRDPLRERAYRRPRGRSTP